MSSAVIALVISLIEEIIKLEPTVAAEIQTLMAKTDATPADWQALKAKVLGETYESLVPDTKLPA